MQYWAGFCHTSPRTSHRSTYVPPLRNLPPILRPSGLSQSTGLSSLCYTANSHWLPTLYRNVQVSVLLSQFVLPSPSYTVGEACSLCLRLHRCPASRFISAIFLDSIHMPEYTIFVLFLTNFTLLKFVHIDSRFFASLGLTQMCSFLKLSNSPLYICTKTFVSIHLAE